MKLLGGGVAVFISFLQLVTVCGMLRMLEPCNEFDHLDAIHVLKAAKVHKVLTSLTPLKAVPR